VAPETLAEAQRAEGQPEPEPDHRPTLDQLIRHCAMSETRPEGWRRGGWSTGTSDAWVASDFMDCLLPEARPEDRPALRRYRAMRMAHADFKRREWDPEKANTHRKVIAAWRENERKLVKLERQKPAAAEGAAAPAPPIPWCTCDGCKFERSHATPASTGPVSTLPTERKCQICGKSLEGRRAEVKACSKWCRRALTRWHDAA
jgi:hypothetical protein